MLKADRKSDHLLTSREFQSGHPQVDQDRRPLTDTPMVSTSCPHHQLRPGRGIGPSTNRGWWGKQLYWLRWVLGAFGWIVTALGAAAITGLIRRD